jgi:hypothetical protein
MHSTLRDVLGDDLLSAEGASKVGGTAREEEDESDMAGFWQRRVSTRLWKADACSIYSSCRRPGPDRGIFDRRDHLHQ